MNDYVEAAKRIADAIEREAMAMGDISYARGIWKAVAPLLPRIGGRPKVPSDAPVESGWRARVMLFDPAGELQADSMPDAAPESEPDFVRGTLGLVGAWVRETAEVYHTERREVVGEGLDAATLERSILSLRVSLSRNAGSTWWRIPYSLVSGEKWRAMVRVERAIMDTDSVAEGGPTWRRDA